MSNFPGPFQVRYFYTTVAGAVVRTHVHAVNCVLNSPPDPGGVFADYDVIRRDGTTLDLDAASTAYAALILALYPAAMTLLRAELWGYAPGTNNAAYYSTIDFSASGTGGGSMLGDTEVIHTYRTINGGSMRLHFYEGTVAAGVTDSPPFATAGHEAIRAFVVSTGNWVYARDNSYPFSAIGLYPGTNERLFKDRYRS